MRTYNYPIPLSTTTMNTTITSPACQLYNIYGYAIQIVWTGTPTGTLKLQVSSDPVPQGPPNVIPPFEPTHWSDLTDSPFAITAAGDYMWNVYDVMYNWVRLVYTDASGGTSTASITSLVINCKGV